MTVRGALRPAAVLRADWASATAARAALQYTHVPHALQNPADSLTGTAQMRRHRSRTEVAEPAPVAAAQALARA